MKQSKHQIWDHIKEKIKNTAWVDALDEVDDISWEQLSNQLTNKLGDQIWVKVRNQIRDRFN